MSDIQDEGKVWLRGKVKPVPAVKYVGTILIPDMEYGEVAKVWGTPQGLCVDVHIKEIETRIVRWFPKGTQGDTPGTLFSGFDNTKHADILAVLPDNPAVQEKKFTEDEYRKVETMNSEKIFEYANFV